MKDNPFDRIIREKLDQLNPEYQPGSWELFEQKLDAEEVGVPQPEEQVIDEAIFNRIHRTEVPYRSEHWSQMAHRLDREFVRPEQVIRYKTLELSLLTVLLFIFWNWAPQSSSLNQPSGTPQALESTRDATGDLAGIAQHTAIDQQEENNAHSQESLPTASQVSVSDALQPAADASAPADVNRELPSIGLLSQIHPTLEYPKIAFGLPEGLLPSTSIPERNMGELAGLGSSSISDPQPIDQAVPAMVALSPNRPSRNMYFGMFGSLDYNRIITPADRFLDVETDELDRYELGYSGGFSFGIDLGNHWEIQTGLIYSAKKYQPSALIVQSGNFRDGYEIEELKDIELNIIHIPLNFRYDLFHYDKWRLYLLAGASLQVATLGNYYVEAEGPRRSSVLSEYIENGWFEGGAFRDNSYVTGNLGMGLEHFVNSKWSIFAQPTYQHAINFFEQGLGSTHDRISTMSIYSGIRIRLKQ